MLPSGVPIPSPSAPPGQRGGPPTVRRPSWSGRPQLRTGERGHRQATWFQLFYDLAFVVIVGQIGERVAADPGWRTVGEAALLLVPSWWAWVGETFYSTRFDAD